MSDSVISIDTTPNQLQTSIPVDKAVEEQWEKNWEQVLPSAPVKEESAKEEPKPVPAAATVPPVVAESAKPEPVAPKPEPALPKKGRKTLEGRKSIDAEFDRVGDHLEEPAVAPALTSDDEIDKLELHPNSSPAVKSQFSELKTIAKRERAERKEAQNQLQILQEALKNSGFDPADQGIPQQIATLRQVAQNASPEVARELEFLRHLQRQVGVAMDDKIRQPAMVKYHALVDKMARHYTANDPEQVKADFTDPMHAKFNPWSPELSLDYWKQQLALMNTDDATKEGLYQELLGVYREKDNADKEAADYAKDPGSFHKFQQKRAADWEAWKADFQRDYGQQIQDEITQVIKERPELKELLPKTLDGITDSAKRAEIEAHNAQFNALNERFSTITSEFQKGPRNAARMGFYCVEIEENIKRLMEENKELKKAAAAAEQLKSEVQKKRRVADAATSPRAGNALIAPPPPPKLKLTDSKTPNWNDLPRS
jgi:hypothetical protein